MLVFSHSVMSDSANTWTVICQAPLSMEFSRQEYWTGFRSPTAGDLPDPGIEPTSLTSHALAGRFFSTVPPRKPKQWPTVSGSPVLLVCYSPGKILSHVSSSQIQSYTTAIIDLI